MRKPAGTRVVLKRSAAKLDIEVPPQGMTGGTLATGGFAVAWNAFIAVWTAGALAGGGILFALFSLPFWAAGAMLARSTVSSALLRERFAIGKSKFRLTQVRPGFGTTLTTAVPVDGRSEAAGVPPAGGGAVGFCSVAVPIACCGEAFMLARDVAYAFTMACCVACVAHQLCGMSTCLNCSRYIP